MPLPNMSMNSAAHQKKVESAMRILQTTTGVKVLQAKILAGFLKWYVASKSVHQAVRHCLQQKESKAHTGRPQGCAGWSHEENIIIVIFILFYRSRYTASSSCFIAVAVAMSFLASSSSSACL
jgi:hypothetical protein